MTAAVLVFVLLLLIGTPIGLLMVMSGLAGSVVLGGLDYLAIIADQMFSGVSGYVLMAIPYFVLTAELMNVAGLTDRLITFNNAVLGRIRGALSHVNITASLFFAGLTGAAVTDAVAIGRVLIPAMKKEGYDPAYSAAVTAAASIIGPIIPPSIIMVVYASMLRGVSVIDLFAAGIVPGVLMALFLLLASGILAWWRSYPVHGPTDPRVAIRAFLQTIPALFVPVIILGGILSGLTTVTEASAFAAMYTIVIGALVYRQLTLAKFWHALVVTVRFSGVVFFLLATSTVLGWFVTRSGIAREAAELITTVSRDPNIQIMLVNLLLVLIGMVIDVLPALVVTAPVLVPAMVHLGFDPLHFAMVMIVTLNFGNVTPPVGMSLMTTTQIAGVSYERAIIASMPFYLSHITVILIVSYWPGLVLWLPSLLK